MGIRADGSVPIQIELTPGGHRDRPFQIERKIRPERAVGIAEEIFGGQIATAAPEQVIVDDDQLAMMKVARPETMQAEERTKHRHLRARGLATPCMQRRGARMAKKPSSSSRTCTLLAHDGPTRDDITDRTRRSPMMKVLMSMVRRASSMSLNNASRACAPSACIRTLHDDGGARPKLSINSAAQCGPSTTTPAYGIATGLSFALAEQQVQRQHEIGNQRQARAPRQSRRSAHAADPAPDW